MQFGRYNLGRKIATGGMGEVYLASIIGVEGFEKPVALKRIYPHLSLDATYRELFIREAKVSARFESCSVDAMMAGTMLANSGHPLGRHESQSTRQLYGLGLHLAPISRARWP